jgi:heme exporter protein D
MSKNSIRQTVSTVSAWRETLNHVKEKKARLEERKRRQNRKSHIQKSKNSF